MKNKNNKIIMILILGGLIVGWIHVPNSGSFLRRIYLNWLHKRDTCMNSTYKWMVFYGKAMFPKNPSGQSYEKPNSRDISG